MFPNVRFKIDLNQISDLDPERIIISPGPCGPIQAGISVDVVKTFSPIKPLLGVCLGHQCVGIAFGCEVKEAGEGGLCIEENLQSGVELFGVKTISAELE